MKKGLFNSKRDYPGINKSDFKPSRNPELAEPKGRYETYGAANETVTSNLLSQKDSLNNTQNVRSISRSENNPSFQRRAQKNLKSIRDTRRSTKNYSSTYLFQGTPEKARKLKKKVDLTKSLNMNTADTSLSMNGMGVYMNVIRESQDISMKKEKLAEQKSRILGMSFDNFGTRDMAQLNNFMRQKKAPESAK